MPSNFMDHRVSCGQFYWTFLRFMGQRQPWPFSKVSGIRFVPHSADCGSRCFIDMKTDCALFFFKHMSYKHTERATSGTRFGTLTALFLGLFLAHFLLECMDVESNPGPQRNEENHFYTDLWSGTQIRKGLPRNHITHFDPDMARRMRSTPQFEHMPRNETTPNETIRFVNSRDNYLATSRQNVDGWEHINEDINGRLNELETSFTTLSRFVSDIQACCSSLQSDTSNLRKEMNQLSTSQTQEQQDIQEHRHMIDNNVTVLYDWCRSLQVENDKTKAEVSRLDHCSQDQSQHPHHAQEEATTPSPSPDTLPDVLHWCHSMQAENDILKEDVRYLSSKCEVLEEQYQHLLDWNGHLSDKCVTNDEKLEKLEAFSRASNIKFFNVSEDKNEIASDCSRQIVQLLTRFFPSKIWSAEDVEKAYRLGPRKNSVHPRPIVVTMHRWRDKLLVLKDQGSRKEMADTLNIRVATDLTDRQNDILREEKQLGRQAFFHRGRLYHNAREVPRISSHSPDQDKQQDHQHDYDRQQDRGTGWKKENAGNPSRNLGPMKQDGTQTRVRHDVRCQREDQQVKGGKENRERDRLQHRGENLDEGVAGEGHPENRQRSALREYKQTGMPRQHNSPEETGGHNGYKAQHQAKENEHRATDDRPEEDCSQQQSSNVQASPEPGVGQQERYRSTRIGNSSHQLNLSAHQLLQANEKVPNCYSLTEFPSLRKEPKETSPAQPSPSKKKASRRSASCRLRSTGTQIPETTHSSPPTDVLNLLPNTGYSHGEEVPNPWMRSTITDTSLNAPDEGSGTTTTGTHDDHSCVQNDLHQHSTYDKASSEFIPCTSEPERDPNQTLPKQLLDPWETAEDGQSKTSLSPCSLSQDNFIQDHALEETSLTVENETASTPVHGPLTRSRVRCKQAYITDSFSSTGARSRKRNNIQLPAQDSPI